MIKHGEPAGYEAHRRAGEKPCPACSAAHRRRHRAYRRALQDLARMYPVRFRELFAARRAEEGLSIPEDEVALTAAEINRLRGASYAAAGIRLIEAHRAEFTKAYTGGTDAIPQVLWATNGKEAARLRSAAWHDARKRLREAHAEEFKAYYAEEKASRGV